MAASARSALLRPGRTLVLDGATGLELKARKAMGLDVAYDLTLFSTAALRDTPRAVVDLHRAYIDAGCDVITTASYAVTRWYLSKIGEEHRVAELNALSVELAREAAAAAAAASSGADRAIIVAGAVPPLGQSYDPTSPLKPEEAAEQYREIVGSLGGCDVLLCETMASVAEARAAAEACAAVLPDTPVWMSFTPVHHPAAEPTADSASHAAGAGGGAALADGSSITDATLMAATHDASVDAVLFNCAAPRVIGASLAEACKALGILQQQQQQQQQQGEGVTGPGPGPGGRDHDRRRRLPIRLGGYANFWNPSDRTGWTIDQQESESGAGDASGVGFEVDESLDATRYAGEVRQWQEASGAEIIGGCCGIGVDFMQAVAQTIRSREEKNTVRHERKE